MHKNVIKTTKFNFEWIVNMPDVPDQFKKTKIFIALTTLTITALSFLFKDFIPFFNQNTTKDTKTNIQKSVKDVEESSITVSDISISNVSNDSKVNISINKNITPEQFRISLKTEREQTIKKMEKVHGEEKKELGRKVTLLESKLAKSKESYDEHLKYLEGIIKAIKEYKDIGKSLVAIQEAVDGLKKGSASKAEEVFYDITNKKNYSSKRRAYASYQLGIIAKEQINFKEAYKRFQHALTLEPNNNLYLKETGLIARELGYYNKAIRHHEKQIENGLKSHDEQHPTIASSKNSLAIAFGANKEWDKAIKNLEQALTANIKNYGKDSPKTAIAIHNLGLAWHGKGRHDKAIDYLEQAKSINIKASTKEHNDVALNNIGLGIVWCAKGFYDKGINYYKKALSTSLNKLNNEHPQIATIKSHLGNAWFEKGNYDKAIYNYEQSLSINLKVYQSNHPKIIGIKNKLSNAWLKKGDYKKSMKYMN